VQPSGGMDGDERRQLHAPKTRWSNEGIVSLVWVRYETGNLLAKVILNWEGFEAAYAICGRKPQTDELIELQAELTSYAMRLQARWMQQRRADIELFMVKRNAWPESLVPTAETMRLLLLEAIAGLEDKGDEVLAKSC